MPNATIRRSIVGSLVIAALAVTVWSAVAQAGPIGTPTATPTAAPAATPTPIPTPACMANDDCAAEEFCRTEPGACGEAGMCEQRPESCRDVFDPVCGCDGRTYGNGCNAAGAGVSIAFAGPCEPTATPTATRGGTPTATPSATPTATATPTPTLSEKVTVCHKGKNLISLPANAVPGHLAHGDTLGAAQCLECEFPVSGTFCACNDSWPICLVIPPVCPLGTVLAVQSGCGVCVDPFTCRPVGR